MKRFSAQIRHQYDTILRMCRVQYDTFCFGRKLAMAALGLALAVLGAANLGNMAGILFAMVGCWLLASLNYPAKVHAERIRDALAIAEEQGLVFSFQKVNLEQAHPNTAVIHLTGASGRTVRVRGASVGGGNIRITNIDGYEVELTGIYPALITIHHDKPGIITKVTQILARYEYNIAFMRVSRQSRGEMAMMILELDEPLSGDVVAECCAVYEVETAFAIPAI